MNIAPAGDRALLITFDQISASDLNAQADAIRKWPGVIAAVPGHSSILAVWAESAPHPVPLTRDHLLPARGENGNARDARTYRLTVSFHESHGPDLPRLLERARIERDQFLARVAELPLVARFLGFRAGFAYLDGWPSEWSLPRKQTSTHVSAGSFGIAGDVAAFYPIDSPGGWNILGRTGAELWSEARVPPNLLAAGDVVKIVPTLEPIRVQARPPARREITIPYAEILSAPSAVVVTAENWSRINSGMSPGGAFDLEAASMARRAAGCAEDGPVLECALVGPRFVARDDVVASWYGSRADFQVNGKAVGDPRQFALRAGDEVRGGRIRDGLRGYLAIGRERGPVGALVRADRLQIRALPGPHQSPVRTIECEVSSRLDRVGIRMLPLQKIDFESPADLRSCGMVCGTLQLHPGGSVVAMGPDHPVTGGYLQVLTVISDDRWKLAQLVPGDRVRFVVDQSP